MYVINQLGRTAFKLKILTKVSLFFIALSALSLSYNVQAACGKISQGEMNWASGQLVSKVSNFILREGYGCKVKTIQTSTVPGITALVNKGEPNFIAEAWQNTIQHVIETSVKSGKLTNLGEIFDQAGENWYIPAYTAKKYNIKTIDDVIANYKIFSDPEVPEKGRFNDCPAGWACEIVNKNLFHAYGMGDKFTLFDTGSGEGLKLSLAKAYARKQPWLGYYWSPTAILGKYKMVAVELNPYDEEGHRCNRRKDCATPHAGRQPAAVVVKLATNELVNRDPRVTAFLKKLFIPSAALLEVLAWREDNRADSSQAAGYFMSKYKKVWTSWLDKEALKKVEAAL